MEVVVLTEKGKAGRGRGLARKQDWRKEERKWWWWWWMTWLFRWLGTCLPAHQVPFFGVGVLGVEENAQEAW